MPERIQLRRTKGWRKPDNVIVVSRPTIYGNPFTVGSWYAEVDGVPYPVRFPDRHPGPVFEVGTVDEAVDLYRRRLLADAVLLDLVRRVLAGHDVGCWCPLDQPCHGDVLLEIANRAPAGDR